MENYFNRGFNIMFVVENYCCVHSHSFSLWRILRVVSAEVVTVHMNEVYEASYG